MFRVHYPAGARGRNQSLTINSLNRARSIRRNIKMMFRATSALGVPRSRRTSQGRDVARLVVNRTTCSFVARELGDAPFGCNTLP
jgi:hypothetical protein